MTDLASSSKKLKIGMVGVGNYGARRRELMRACGGFSIIAAFDHNAETLARACKEEGAQAAGSYEAMLDTPGLDAVVVSTGANVHAEQVRLAAERGLHVFVEKPVCCNPEEAAMLRETQRNAKVVIGSGHDDHSNEATSLTIERLLRGGELGIVAAVEATTAHSGGLQLGPNSWRGKADKNPGGMLFQCGVHKIHELRFFFGRIVRVSAMMRYDVHTTETADVAICHLEFESGLIGTLNAYHVVPYYHRLCILGTQANLFRTDRFFDEGTSLEIQRETAENRGKKQPLEPVAITGTDDPAGALRSWHRAIMTGGDCYPSLDDGLQAVEVVFAAEKSAREGRVVELR